MRGVLWLIVVVVRVLVVAVVFGVVLGGVGRLIAGC